MAASLFSLCLFVILARILLLGSPVPNHSSTHTVYACEVQSGRLRLFTASADFHLGSNALPCMGTHSLCSPMSSNRFLENVGETDNFDQQTPDTRACACIYSYVKHHERR